MAIFKHLLVLGRPATGKSEFIDFLKKMDPARRAELFHIGGFEEVDDFPWIWEKFQDDDIWEEIGEKRVFSENYMPNNPGLKPDGERLYRFCMAKFNHVIRDQYLSRPDFYRDNTLLIEFSRGGKSGFRDALPALKREILVDAAIFYIHVSREESWRRNVARYQEKLKHSILAHMVPKETYDTFYAENDWADLTGKAPHGYLDVHDLKVPFVTMGNEPESTDPAVLEPRYGNALRKLMELRSAR